MWNGFVMFGVVLSGPMSTALDLRVGITQLGTYGNFDPKNQSTTGHF
jgi:hypothetical protein